MPLLLQAPAYSIQKATMILKIARIVALLSKRQLCALKMRGLAALRTAKAGLAALRTAKAGSAALRTAKAELAAFQSCRI